MEANQQQNDGGGPNNNQLEQLLRRFRSKNDLYKYLNEAVVSIPLQFTIWLLLFY